MVDGFGTYCDRSDVPRFEPLDSSADCDRREDDASSVLPDLGSCHSVSQKRIENMYQTHDTENL